MRGSMNFLSGGRGGVGGWGWGVQAPQLILQFKEGVQWFYNTFSRGRGPTFSRGGGPIETHITITCDFPGGSGPPIPPLDPHMVIVAFWQEWAQTSLCGLLLS